MRTALVVGAGYSGAVSARVLADSGWDVLVIDRRDHIAGNAHDYQDEHGLLVHKYGPHIFHTNSPEVVNFLSRFTGWRPYEHRVLAKVKKMLLPIPINRTTLNRLYKLDLKTDEETAAYLDSVRHPVKDIQNSEDVAFNAVGQELTDLFFRGYTFKQWGMALHDLSTSVVSRIPTRTNEDDRYFTDDWQQMPDLGYTEMFRRMLDHPRIRVELRKPYDRAEGGWDHTVYTGPLDEFFGHSLGRLPYRSLLFKHVHYNKEWLQPVGQVNYPSIKIPYTRITEWKHLTGQTHPGTSVAYEYPMKTGEPFYPVPTHASQELKRRYEELARALPDVTFVGRLAQYRYYNMDQACAAALTAMKRLVD